jgi:inactivated superfamily I helicase
MADTQVPPLGNVLDEHTTELAAKNTEIERLKKEVAYHQQEYAKIADEIQQRVQTRVGELSALVKHRDRQIKAAADQITGWMNAVVVVREGITTDPVPTGTTRGYAHKGEFSPQCVRELENVIAQMRDIVAHQ